MATVETRLKRLEATRGIGFARTIICVRGTERDQSARPEDTLVIVNTGIRREEDGAPS